MIRDALFCLPPREQNCRLRLILMRHGQPSKDTRRRCYGKLDVGLSQAGREQIRKRIAFLQCLGPEALYTSTSTRAMDSAAEIGRELHLQPQPVRELCEINFGAFEGLTYQEIEARYPQEYERWMEHPTKITFPGGESFEEMECRALTCQAFLILTHKGQAVLTVSHSGVNRILLAHALRLPSENLFRIDQAYAAINIIDYYEDFALVRLMNG